MAKQQTKAKKTTKKKVYKQTGTTTMLVDVKLSALMPGPRISASGAKYYEARRNRSDSNTKRRI
jgi:hypothetical protein